MQHDIIRVVNPSQHLLDRVSQISDEAFKRRAWSSMAVQPLSVPELLGLEGTELFVGLAADDEITGFSIGTILSPKTILFFGLASEYSTEQPVPTWLPKPGDYHLTWRAVAEPFRHQGWGQALTLARLDTASQFLCSRVYAETILNNSGTVAMHGHLGFEIYRRTRHLSNGRCYERVYFYRHLSPAPAVMRI
jgi:ribosomal protein S18 acetylase RimI-like enzyme